MPVFHDSSLDGAKKYKTKCANGRFKSGKRKGHCKPSKGSASKSHGKKGKKGKKAPKHCRDRLREDMQDISKKEAFKNFDACRTGKSRSR